MHDIKPTLQNVALNFFCVCCSTLDAYLMERVLEEREAEGEFGEDVLRRAAGLLSARRQIIHKWDLTGLAAGDLVRDCRCNPTSTTS